MRKDYCPGQIWLNLGSGSMEAPGFVNVDIEERVLPELCADVVSIPVSDKSVEKIQAIHILEHMFPWDAERALKEWHRVLKPGGRVIIECPDLRKAVKWLSRHEDFASFAPFGMGRVYGDVLKQNPYMMHRWGMTAAGLRRMLESLGFVDVRERQPSHHYPDRDLRVEAVRLSGDQPHRKKGPQVSWLLLGDESVASSRFHGYLPHRYLVSQGVESRLLLAPPLRLKDIPWSRQDYWMVAELIGSHIVVVQKLTGPRTEKLVRFLNEAGATVVYVESDYRPSNRIPFLCDEVVCPSRYLADYYRARGISTTVIDDPAEYYCARSSIAGRHGPVAHLRLCWIGHRDNWETLALIREVLEESEFSDMQLITVSNHPEADVVWSPEAVKRILKRCDIGVVPTDETQWNASKSSNRVALFMAAGLPVVAGNIPSYSRIVDTGCNGYIADKIADYRVALRALRDPQHRREIALRAHDFATASFSPGVVGRRWLELFESLTETPKPTWIHMDSARGQARHRMHSLVSIKAKLRFARLAVKRRKWLIALSCAVQVMLRAPWYPSTRLEMLRTCSRMLSAVARRAASQVYRYLARRSCETGDPDDTGQQSL